MNDGVTWSMVFPIVATLFGVVASALMGMAVSKLTVVESHLAKMNGRMDDHIENKDLHYAAQAKLEEQIRNLMQTVKIAHDRVDRIEERVQNHGGT